MTDAVTVRKSFEVLWERDGRPLDDLDPLDFRFSWEPLEVPEPAAAAFAGLLRHLPLVRRVEATVERLWKNGSELRSNAQFYVEFIERRPHDFEHVSNAAREAGIALRRFGMTAGRPWDDRIRTAVLFER